MSIMKMSLIKKAILEKTALVDIILYQGCLEAFTLLSTFQK